MAMGRREGGGEEGKGAGVDGGVGEGPELAASALSSSLIIAVSFSSLISLLMKTHQISVASKVSQRRGSFQIE